jgi:putative endonuclease
MSFRQKNKNMFYVYYLQSISYPDRTYIGFTSNMKQRFTDHNDGKSIYTKDFRPWKIIGFLAFDQELKAIRFEKHLKSHAGRIFLNRYFNDENEPL